LVFGYIGDKYGRVQAFQITSKIIFLPVILIPLLPTYNDIGVWAPILLLIMRMIQGFCIGAEFAGGFIYICENSKKKNLFFAGSIGSCTGILGILLASFVSFLCHHFFERTALESYGWRIAFFIAIIFAVISFIMRRKIRETDEFQESCKQNEISFNPFKETIKNWRIMLIAFGLVYMHATSFYFIFIYLPTYINEFIGFKDNLVLMNNSLYLLFNLIAVPIFGLIADKIGGAKLLKLSTIIVIIGGLPLYWLLSTEYCKYVLIIFSFVTILNSASVPGLLVQMIPARIRFLGMSFVFNICFGIFGGLVPTLSLTLIKLTGNQFLPLVYLITTAIITNITLIYMNRGSYEKEAFANS
jgi:MHS family proline/betaine transporter-like MFS transporter